MWDKDKGLLLPYMKTSLNRIVGFEPLKDANALYVFESDPNDYGDETLQQYEEYLKANPRNILSVKANKVDNQPYQDLAKYVLANNPFDEK